MAEALHLPTGDDACYSLNPSLSKLQLPVNC